MRHLLSILVFLASAAHGQAVINGAVLNGVSVSGGGGGGGGLAFAELTQGVGTSDPQSTASISPTANAQVIVTVAVSEVGGGVCSDSDGMSVSGCSLTWTEIGQSCDQGNSRRQVWFFRGVSATPGSSCTLSFDVTHLAGTHEEMIWSVDEVTGANASTPVGTFVENHQASGTSVTVTVSGTPDAGDFVYFGNQMETDEAMTINGELDTTLTQLGGGTGVRRIVAAYDSSPDATPVPGVSWTTTSGSSAGAFIINVAP